jgi:inhibitor of KinA sporulation pathway (predicted exonuclease)
MGKIRIIFDLEATCEDKSKVKFYDNETIEIGAVKVQDGKVIDEFQAFIKPIKNKNLTVFCKELTKISQDDIDNAKGFKEVIQSFKDWVDGSELCSWGFYDRKQFEKDCRRYGLSVNWLTNHRSLKHEHGELKNLSRPVGVQKALSMEGFKFEGTPHRGIDDAKNIVRIYQAVFKED